VGRILAETGYPLVGEWGPLYGSYLTTIFGQGDKPDFGDSIFPELTERLSHLTQRIPPQAINSVRVVLVVGTFVVTVVGAAPVAAALGVPVIVIEYIAITTDGVAAIEAIRHVLRA
jgi:hypothetical protein